MLQKMLAQMIYNVEVSGRPQYRTLKNKLTITIQPNPNSYTLTLSREDVYPSFKEWETVIWHFPYFVEIVQPEKVDNGNVYALTAYIPKEKI